MRREAKHLSLKIKVMSKENQVLELIDGYVNGFITDQECNEMCDLILVGLQFGASKLILHRLHNEITTIRMNPVEKFDKIVDEMINHSNNAGIIVECSANLDLQMYNESI
jgi:hypothetical protein